jgi:hypothetical protein
MQFPPSVSQTLHIIIIVIIIAASNVFAYEMTCKSILMHIQTVAFRHACTYTVPHIDNVWAIKKALTEHQLSFFAYLQAGTERAHERER